MGLAMHDEPIKLVIRAVHRLNGAMNIIVSNDAVLRLLSDKERMRLSRAIRQGWEDTEKASSILNGGRVPPEL